MLNVLEMYRYHRCEESLSGPLLSERWVLASQRNILPFCYHIPDYTVL